MYMGHHTSMFLTIYSCIQSGTLAHIWYNSISPFKHETLSIYDLVT